MKTQKYVKIIIWYLNNFVSFLLDFRKKVCFQSNLSFSNMHSKLFSNLHSEIPIMLKMEIIGPFFSRNQTKNTKKWFFGKTIFSIFGSEKILVRKNFRSEKKLKIKIFDLRKKKNVLSFRNSALGSGGPEHIAWG